MSTPPHLPPRGIFIPTPIIFHPQLSSAVLVTWMKLRCLAWDGWTTPPLTLPELATLVGIHPARLNRHLAELMGIPLLSWHADKHGKISITFPLDSYEKPARQVEPFKPLDPLPTGLKLEQPDAPASYFPSRILGYLSYEDDQENFSNEESPEKPGSDYEKVKYSLTKTRDCVLSQRP